MNKKTRVVVDTNVLVVANGLSVGVDSDCELACVNRLLDARDRCVVFLDDADRIMSEYNTYVNFSGMPSVGDMFYRYLFDNQYAHDSVRRVTITAVVDEGRGYQELPENKLKAGDRAILAVAVVGGAAVVNATDSDWVEQRDLLVGLVVPVEQVCPRYSVRGGPPP